MKMLYSIVRVTFHYDENNQSEIWMKKKEFPYHSVPSDFCRVGSNSTKIVFYTGQILTYLKFYISFSKLFFSIKPVICPIKFRKKIATRATFFLRTPQNPLLNFLQFNWK